MNFKTLFKKKSKDLKASKLFSDGEVVALKESGTIYVNSCLELDVPCSAIFMYLDKITDMFSYNESSDGKYNLSYSSLPLTAKSLSKRLEEATYKRPEKKILADLYFINMSPINYTSLESYKITLEDVKYKRVNVKVLFNADITITDARQVLQLLRNERALIRPGYARKSIASWVREVIRLIIEKANIPLELLKFAKENSTNLIIEKAVASCKKLGLNLSNFQITAIKVSTSIEKKLENEANAKRTIGSEFSNFTQQDESAILLQKIKPEAAQDKDLEVTQISGNVAKDKKTILNIETGDELVSHGFDKIGPVPTIINRIDQQATEMSTPKGGFETVGNYYNTMNELIKEPQKNVRELVTNSRSKFDAFDTLLDESQSSNSWKAKTTGEKFYTVNLDTDESKRETTIGPSNFENKNVASNIKYSANQYPFAKEEVKKFCANCGNKVSKDDVFCSKCGNKLK